ncbi:MlaD family protein [Nocardia huaxiensis]|uniref:MCE family protein n=1 Tax=Nocardia huaxiensis TaxID=2755382 RepID=A0A7D6V9E8_9NOCA|nr:MlaD family protein [Nocardia huaxiensis]QLY29511.1 MCE family protein [Nocardia huaxiensis]UFS96931.1 MlaD family protein [Nocardia huaxiensis]
MRGKRWRIAVLGVVTVSSVTGCAVRPLDMPLPGTRYGKPTYQVRVEFGNVLSLPLKTKVELNGAQVGIVESVSVRPRPDANVPGLPADQYQPYYQPTAVLAIDSAVKLPVETRVEMAQQTLFGDTFVKLTLPQGGSGRMLGQGGVIPITQTKPASTVEQYMTAVVGWVTGGNIPFVQSFVSSVNQAFPADSGDFREFMSKLTVTIERMGTQTGELSAILNNATAALETFRQAEDVWRFVFDQAPVLLDVVQKVLPDILYFVDEIRGLAGYAGQVLIDTSDPKVGKRVTMINRFLDVWTPLAQALIATPDEVPRTLEAVNALLSNKIVPFLSARGLPSFALSEVVPQTPASALTGDPEADARITAANEQAFRDRVNPVLKLVGLMR